MSEIRGRANGHCKQSSEHKGRTPALVCPAPHFRVRAGPKRGGGGVGTGPHLPPAPSLLLRFPLLTSPVTGRWGNVRPWQGPRPPHHGPGSLCQQLPVFQTAAPPCVLCAQDLDSLPSPPSLVSLHGRQMEILEDRKERSGREGSRRGRKGAGLMKPCHSRATEMGEVFAAAGEKRTRSCVISDTCEAVSASKTLQSGDSRGRGTQA